MTDRAPIPKKLRFEVFKRDSFTCQYCGRKSPEFVLHCDHIKPVAEGGATEMLNLVTACNACNLGKGAILLDDASAVERQRRQIEELNERRQQIEMMLEWRDELAKHQVDEVQVVADAMSARSKFEPNDNGKTRLLFVDPARLSTPRGMRDGPTMRGGVEINERTGAPVAYHIRKSHPGDGYRIRAGANSWERIPAYHRWGRTRVIHVFESERFGQSRGKPIITAVARQFKMLDHYHREQLRQAVLDSLVFAALETPMEQAAIAELFGGETDPMGAYQQSVADWGLMMKGGAMIPLPPGTSLKEFAPKRGPNSLDAFTTVMLRHIATGLNMPYELVFRDFSKTNYSSARAALMEAWRYFMSVRQFVADHWASIVYELWFEEAVDRGRIPDCAPADYYANQVAWTRCKWIGAGRGWIDPLKEAKAVTERLQTVSTLEDEAALDGKDWDDVLEQRAEENARAAELGLPLPHRDRTPGAVAPDEPDEPEKVQPND